MWVRPRAYPSEAPFRDKHSSLLRTSVNYGRKKFITLDIELHFTVVKLFIGSAGDIHHLVITSVVAPHSGKQRMEETEAESDKDTKLFGAVISWGQCYKSFYRSNLPPFQGNPIILCYKAILHWKLPWNGNKLLWYFNPSSVSNLPSETTKCPQTFIVNQ